MPIRCVERPNRKGPRVFTLKALERITGYVKDDGVPVWTILFSVIAATGLGVVICRAAVAMKRVVSLWSIFKNVSKAQAIVVVLILVIQWLAKSPIRLIPVVNAIIIVGLAITLIARALLDDIIELAADVLLANEVIDLLIAGCESIGEAVESGKDKLDDIEVPDLPDWIHDLAKKL